MNQKLKTIFTKNNIKLFLTTLLFVVLGILFCVMQGAFVEWLASVLGIVLLFGGLIGIIAYGILPVDGKVPELFVYSFLGILGGALLLFLPKWAMIVLGVFLGANGMLLVIDALKSRKKQQSWKSNLIVGIVVVCLSLVLIILSGTHVANNILAIYIGVTLLFEAIYNIVLIVMFFVKLKGEKPDRINLAETTPEQVQETTDTQE